MALALQAVGCSTSFTSGAPLIEMRASPSRAKAMSPRSSLVLPGGDESNLSNVDYNDVTSQWISADFLDLRLRSSSLICNEAVQALRKHFEGKGRGASRSYGQRNGQPTSSGATCTFGKDFSLARCGRLR